MNFETVIKARTPRTNCAECGVKTVAVPWANKNSRFTLMFEAFAIDAFLKRRAASKQDANFRDFLGTARTPSSSGLLSADWLNVTSLRSRGLVLMKRVFCVVIITSLCSMI